jgi:HYDIN/CFA65/VesB-like, Ig-like domain/Abnormal spindle-like microcephaly-assoc'd, ASPM-SPD-2-Hydin/Right handed beta helix region/Flagellar-associated PapD-like
VTLTNTGTVALTVSQASVTGNGFSLSGLPLPVTLAPGNTASPNVVFAPRTAGTANGSLSLVSDATNSPTVVSLTGAGATLQLSASPGTIDFGNVAPGSSASQTVTLTNAGTGTLTITQANVSGSGFSLSGLKMPLILPAGQSSAFKAIFSPTVAGNATGSVSVVSDASNSPAVVSLAGAGLTLQLSASPSSLSFGNVALGAKSTQAVTLTNTGTGSITVTEVKVAGTGFSVSGLAMPVTLAGGQSTQFETGFTPAVTGNASGSISVVSSASNSPASVSLSGTGVTLQLAASPSSVDFGNVVIGGKVTQSITLTNTGTGSFTVTQASATGTGFSFSGPTLPLTLAGGQTTSFNVVFSLTTSAGSTGNLSVVSTASNSPLVVPLSGAGVTLQLSASPSSLSFGDVGVGERSTQSLTLTNAGTGTVTITQASVTGDGFSLSGLTVPMTLAAGQSTNFGAKFAPTTSGSATGSISVVSNASNSPTVVSLSGTGVTLQLSASPTTVNFGDVAVGTSTSQAITLTNAGTGSVTVAQANVAGTGFSVSGLTLPLTLTAGQSTNFNAVFSASTTGNATGSISVVSTASNSPATVALSGCGGGGGGGGGTVYYVATNGNDSFSGTLDTPNAQGTDGPFRTLTKAQQAVDSAISSSSSVTVEIRAGNYFLSAPLSFGTADSGSPSVQITWEGYPGDAQPVISGGQRLTGWTNVSGNEWTVRIPSSFSNFEALYYNGVRRFRPRTTSDTYLRLNPVIMPTSSGNCTEAFEGGYRCSDRFSFSPGDLSADYHDITDVEIISFEKWTVSRMRLMSVDAANDIAYLTGQTGKSQNFGYLPDHRYLVDNVSENFNVPGEWYLDRGTTPWTLAYLANANENPNTDEVIVPQQPQILVASGLEHVTFKNIAFEHDDYTIPAGGHVSTPGESSTPAAISFNNCSNVTLSGVTIAHMQAWGLEFIGTAVAGEGNTVTGSVVYDIGTGGIRLGQVAKTGDTDANVSQVNTISDTMVFSTGRFLPAGEGTGIWIGSSHHNTVTHNDVHDLYNGAIELGQSPDGSLTYTHDNMVSYNKLYDLGQGTTSDMGCIHIGSANNTGNQVLNNVCHDVTHDPGPHGYGGFGIYLDGNSQNVSVENNLVYRTSAASLELNLGSANNTVINNIFAFGRQAMIRRGMMAGTFAITHNIFLYDIGQIQDGQWPCVSNCRGQFTMDNNIYWNPSGTSASFIVTDTQGHVTNTYSLSQWQSATGEDQNSLNADPDFQAPGYPNDNFSLMPGSPAFSSNIAFTQFSTSDVGPTTTLNVPPDPVPEAFPQQLLNPATDF